MQPRMAQSVLSKDRRLIRVKDFEECSSRLAAESRKPLHTGIKIPLQKQTFEIWEYGRKRATLMHILAEGLGDAVEYFFSEKEEREIVTISIKRRNEKMANSACFDVWEQGYKDSTKTEVWADSNIEAMDKYAESQFMLCGMGRRFRLESVAKLSGKHETKSYNGSDSL